MRPIVYSGYFEVDGVEVVNSARASAYGARVGVPVQCLTCDTLPGAVGDNPYVDPVTDNAPWLDPTVAESRLFAGVAGLDVAGIGSVTVERGLSPLLGDGSVLGPSRLAHREVTVSALLIAANDCGLSYGLSWLSSVLADSLCGSGDCVGSQLCFFSCCPPGPGDDQLRTLFDVGRVTGPQVTQVTRIPGGGVHAQVEWSWAAGKPWIYSRLDAITGGAWRSLGADGVIRIDPGGDGCPPEDIDCATDPDCDRPPLPPLPPVPPDPCYPLEPYMAARAVFAVGQASMPVWKETVPVIDIRTGAGALRRVGVRFQVNPAGLDCLGSLDPCAACEHITTTYIPPGSSLRIDGRVQRALVDCPGGTGALRGTATLYGPGGGVFAWPVLPYTGGLCIEVYAEASTVDEQAQARVYLVPREDAA